MRDIETREDIKVFVDAFYEKVQGDDLLAPVFATRIEANNWQPHLSRMYDFWQTVLFHRPLFKGNPFGKHIGLEIEDRHFFRWRDLFFENMDELFAGEIADEAKKRVGFMSEMFAAKMKFVRANYTSNT